MAMMIVAASQDPALLERVTTQATEPTSPVFPDPLSGQDVDGVEVPELEVPAPTPTTTPATPTPSPTPNGAKVDVKNPANEVTKLLTGDLSTAADGLPVTDEALSGVGTTLDGTVDGVQGAVNDTTGPLLP